jgi:hypothetical protein
MGGANAFLSGSADHVCGIPRLPAGDGAYSSLLLASSSDLERIMANPIFAKKADKSLAKAIKTAMKDGALSASELRDLIVAALDPATKKTVLPSVDDVEYRDLRRFMRKEKRLTTFDRVALEAFLALVYPLKGPFTFPGDVTSLEGADPKGSGQCAALVQTTIPIGLTKTWREGIRVQGNGAVIKKGTAVATFVDGYYPNNDHDNHVAYYLEQDLSGVTVIDQWLGKGVSSRLMRFGLKRSDGLYHDPSNNGAALSVIMTK